LRKIAGEGADRKRRIADSEQQTANSKRQTADSVKNEKQVEIGDMDGLGVSGVCANNGR
jgi:hypothetical protein